MSVAAIRLSPLDNVAVAARALSAGETVEVEGVMLTIAFGVPIGHKIALTPLKAGDKALKYGMPIGSMTADAAPGEWVHIHNMQSDYISTHLRDAQGDRA